MRHPLTTYLLRLSRQGSSAPSDASPIIRHDARAPGQKDALGDGCLLGSAAEIVYSVCYDPAKPDRWPSWILPFDSELFSPIRLPPLVLSAIFADAQTTLRLPKKT